MSRVNFFIVLVLVGTLVAVARPQEKKKKDRVVHDKDLSDEEHFNKDNHEHNPEYDHEAFLGEEEAKKFEELTPEQSQERLRKMVGRIDKNEDGFVTEEELADWIKYAQNRYVWEDAERQLGSNDQDKDGFVTWDEYKNATYGFLDDPASENEVNYKDMIKRDQRRFSKADKDGDNKLDKKEFVAFLHPENDDNMKDIVIEETMEDIDKDKDGYLSLDEYIGDLWPEDDRKKGVEPEWVKTEREQFSQFRDTNKDGKMDKDEVRAWILPPEFDHVSSEAKHLISESDVDKDGKLTEKEIVDKYDLFVGSQATDFGEALKRHDEF